MLKVFLLVVFVAVGCIVAIPLKRIYDVWLGTSWPTGWFSNYELAAFGLVPIVFLIFVVFAGPAKRVLKGGMPWQTPEKKTPKYITDLQRRMRR